MKPIKLTMSAFGPYGDTQIIDFDLFKDQSIFVITGKTGSGKTTIFDGICYALYGMASGSDRDGESLRSHFNKDDTLTFVELEFLLRGETYSIKRIPRQMRPVKKGEGYTEQKPEVEFKTPGGKVTTGIEKVNEEIVSLLGMNYNQFRQIVMIPQGEFREFLLAESKSRETIFRKIFGTYQFQAIQDTLDKESRDLKTLLTQLEQNEKIYIKSIDSGPDDILKNLIIAEYINVNGVTEALGSFIERDKLAESNHIKSIKNLDKELDMLNRELIKGMETNNHFKEEEEAQKHKKALEDKIELNKDKEKVIQRGRKALTIKATEDSCIQQYKFMKQKEKESEEAKNTLKIVALEQINSKRRFEKEKEKEGEIKKLSENLVIYKKDKVKVVEYANKITEQNESEEQLKKETKKRNDLGNRIDALKKNGDAKEKELGESQIAALSYEKKKSELDKAKETYTRLERLFTGYKELKTISREYTTQKDQFDIIDTNYKSIKNKYEYLNEMFLKGQAGLLAQELKEGIPCPVCGGTEHPKPAKIEVGTPSEKELKDLKAEFDETDENRRNLLTKLTELKTKEDSQMSVLEGYRDDLISIYQDLPDIDDKTVESSIIKEKDTISDKIMNLSKETKKLFELKESEKSIKLSIEQIKDELGKEEKSFEKTNSDCIELSVRIKNLADTIKDLAKELPEGITTTEAMEKMISEAENKLISMEKSKMAAEEALKAAETKLTKADTTNKEKINAYEEAGKEYNKALLKLDEDIKKAGFLDRNDYKASRMEESKIEATEREVKDYYGDLKSARDRYAKALKVISGLAFVDTEKIENKIKEKKKQKDEDEGQNKIVYARLKKNIDVQNNLLTVRKEIKKQDAQYRKINDLAELAKGNNNEKLSFERYVLAAYFDDIIEAANIRLKRMTDGRFELTRIQEKQKGRAQQGLDLEVYDYYTGRPRHVKVISGGESFKASLSLALGLSDVVSSTSGGISIDTMFIDEGFGTLDPESLEKSIECLLDLQQSGKYVGVISHVPELKERIRARIEITADITGSEAKIVVN